jgi:hypothetical protein
VTPERRRCNARPGSSPVLSERARGSHKYGRIGLVAAAVILASAALPAFVVAADPSETVAHDATLTVRFTDAVTLLPVDAAQVHVIARHADAVIGEFDGTTDLDGAAVLNGLPIETGSGPAVRLQVTADKATTFEDAETGCSLAESWHAERVDVAVDGPAVEVAFGTDEQNSTSSITCPDTTVPSGGVGAIIGGPQITPPATDVEVSPRTGRSDTGAALVVGFLFALAGVSLIARRPRRD